MEVGPEDRREPGLAGGKKDLGFSKQSSPGLVGGADQLRADLSEILLFGTGSRVIPAPRAVRDYISSLGIQLDVMDSVSAFSIYND